MNSRYIFQGCLVAALVILGANFRSDRAIAAQEDQATADQGVEVLTRGPVHEAFAETITFDPQPGIVVPKAPPEAIEELPPDQRPAGDHVAWIPGYWAWDEERDDFLWVSGIWRALPPGRQWVPGYWSSSDQEYQWTSGYWADAKLTESEYLPEPPATVEAGPNTTAPSADQVWLPGSWVWNQNRYVWRPGYWAAGQQNWMWVPAHYLWSPRGYVFVDGYYDHSVARRGVLFAPVYFQSNVYAQQGFTYSPVIAINTAVFGSQLFLRPNYNHYYFGDYYGSNYATAGYTPWISFNSGGYGYDPFYAQQQWQNRENPSWSKSVAADFQHRVDHEDARPPRTWAAQQALLQGGDTANAKNFVAAALLSQLATTKGSALKLQPVTKDEQQTLAKHGQAVHQFGQERQKLEGKAAEKSTEKPAKTAEPAKLKFPKSPILATSPDQIGKDQAPPKAHEAPRFDPKIEPKPRPAVARGESPQGETKTPNAERPKVKPKAEPRTDPKVAPKHEVPRVEPKSVPKAEPKPAPKVQPKPEPPKAEPRTTPKLAPKPAVPRVEPKPEPPNAEPINKPKPVVKDKSKP